MKEIEIEVKIPDKMSDIKLIQYQTYIKLLKTEKDEAIIQNKLVEYMCGLDLQKLGNLKRNDVVEIYSNLITILDDKPELVKTFKIKDIEFGFIPSLENMSFAEYVDLDNYITDWETMHKAMAVLYRPILKQRKAWFNRKSIQYKIEPYNGTIGYAELMKHMPLDAAISAYFFLLSLGQELVVSSIYYLENNPQLKTILEQHSSDKNGVGTNLSMDLLKETLQSLTQ